MVTQGLLTHVWSSFCSQINDPGIRVCAQAPNYNSSVLDKETDFQLLYWKLSLDSGGNIYFSSFIRNLLAVVAASDHLFVSSNFPAVDICFCLYNTWLMGKKRREREKNTEPLNQVGKLP